MFNTKLKRFIAVVASICLLAAGVVYAQVEPQAKFNVQLSTDLYQDAKLAKEKNVLIVVMFSQEGCVYCSIVRENFLKPMLISGDYVNKVIIREVKIDSFEDVRDFNGKMILSDELATQYQAYLTPTVIVFDSTGTAHHRIVGVVNEYYYSAELDDAIDKAISRVSRVATTR